MSNPFATWTAARVLEHNDRVAGGKPANGPNEFRAEPVRHESDLHDAIIDYCRSKGWICFHGSTSHRTRRTVGEPDCIVVCQDRVHFIECKRPGQKPTPVQAATIAWLQKLGAWAHIVHNMEEFRQAIA